MAQALSLPWATTKPRSRTMPTGEPYYAMEYVPGTDLEQLWIETAGHVDVSVADLTSATFSGAVSTV